VPPLELLFYAVAPTGQTMLREDLMGAMGSIC